MKNATLFILILATGAVALIAQPPSLPQYPAAGSVGLDSSRRQQCGWYKGNHITLSAKSQGKDGETIDTFEIYDDKNILIAETEHLSGTETKHQILLVDGYWMLARNANLPQDAEIDYLDAPIMFLKLGLELLCQAAPGPPEEIIQRVELNPKAEKKHAIEVKSGAASMDIKTPWTLRGKIEPADQGRITFELSVNFKYVEPEEYIIVGGMRVKVDQKNAKARREEILLSGTWQHDAAAPLLGDDLSLENWQIFSIGLIKRQSGGMTTIDYGARPSNVRAKTIGELRKSPKPQ
ncbi:MAG TPA: hypothetical protein VEW69_13330 [Alphaproteobacteria bacterium]|nr:hypothetical protein [Alphaproteobacteria bacterium]